MKRMVSPMRRVRLAAWLVCVQLLAGVPALGQEAFFGNAALERADWKEDAVPPPPAYSLDHLINVELPRAASRSVKIGIAPETIQINKETGIVRYVAVARGPGATNAMYEGIRCATGEYRVYARQVIGQPWTEVTDDAWQTMRGQTSYPHPYQLARDGICYGTAINGSARDIVRTLKSPKGTLYDD